MGIIKSRHPYHGTMLLLLLIAAALRHVNGQTPSQSPTACNPSHYTSTGTCFDTQLDVFLNEFSPPLQVPLTLTASCGLPLAQSLDFYFLWDASYSSRQFSYLYWEHGTRRLMNIMNAIAAVNPTVRFGLGFFTTKRLVDLGDSNDFVYYHAVNLTSNITAVDVAFNVHVWSKVAAISDVTSSIEAYMQVVMRARLGMYGFRPGSRRVVLVATDVMFGQEGDVAERMLSPLTEVEPGYPTQPFPRLNNYDAVLENDCSLSGQVCLDSCMPRLFQPRTNIPSVYCSCSGSVFDVLNAGTISVYNVSQFYAGSCEDFPNKTSIATISEGGSVANSPAGEGAELIAFTPIDTLHVGLAAQFMALLNQTSPPFGTVITHYDLRTALPPLLGLTTNNISVTWNVSAITGYNVTNCNATTCTFVFTFDSAACSNSTPPVNNTCLDITNLIAGVTLDNNVCSSAAFTSGADSVVNGYVHAAAAVTLGANSIVNGNVVSGAGFTSGANSIVYGNVNNGAAYSSGDTSIVTGCVNSVSDATLGAHSIINGTLFSGSNVYNYGLGAQVLNGSCAGGGGGNVGHNEVGVIVFNNNSNWTIHVNVTECCNEPIFTLSHSHSESHHSASHHSDSHHSESHHSESHHSKSHESDSKSHSESHHSPSHHSKSHESDSKSDSKSHHSKSHHSPNGTRSQSHHSHSHHSESHSPKLQTTSQSESGSGSRSNSGTVSETTSGSATISENTESGSESESTSQATKSHNSKSHRSQSHHSKSHDSKSHRSQSHNKTRSHSHSHSHRSKSHHSLNETRSHSHHSRSPSHNSHSHHSHSHHSKSHHSPSHRSHSHHSESHSESHHSKSHESHSQSETAAMNTFPAPDLTVLIILLPIIGFLALCCIFFLLCTRRYRRRRRTDGYEPLAQ
jgi:hypothetical protein